MTPSFNLIMFHFAFSRWLWHNFPWIGYSFMWLLVQSLFSALIRNIPGVRALVFSFLLISLFTVNIDWLNDIEYILAGCDDPISHFYSENFFLGETNLMVRFHHIHPGEPVSLTEHGWGVTYRNTGDGRMAMLECLHPVCKMVFLWCVDGAFHAVYLPQPIYSSTSRNPKATHSTRTAYKWLGGRAGISGKGPLTLPTSPFSECQQSSGLILMVSCMQAQLIWWE